MHEARTESRKTVLAAARVCRRWREPAQRALFESVDLHGLMKDRQAKKWLESPTRARFHAKDAFLVGHDTPGVLEACRGVTSLAISRLQLPTAPGAGRYVHFFFWNLGI